MAPNGIKLCAGGDRPAVCGMMPLILAVNVFAACVENHPDTPTPKDMDFPAVFAPQ